jgi:RND family efflux transporter MFP subunit
MRKQTNNKLALSALLIASSMIFLAGCTSVPEVQSSVDEIKMIPIELTSMKKDMVEHTYISIGEVVPSNQVDIFVNGNGFIETIAVEVGDPVSKDQMVIQLDEAVADRSTYNSTESQLRTVREDLRAQLASAKENLALQEELFAEGIVTKAEIDQVTLLISSLERQFNNAAVAYRTQLSAIEESLANSVKNRTIYSPINGIVAAVYVKEGQSVANQLSLTIIDDSAMYVKTSISSDLKKLLSEGQSVRLKLDGDNDQVTVGVIDQINALPDVRSKLFDALIRVEDTTDYIIGDYAEVEFVIERYEAVMIPTKSIVRSGLDTYIYTLENDELTKSSVETGRTKEDWIEIKGVTMTKDVVVRGQNQLTADSQFRIVE